MKPRTRRGFSTSPAVVYYATTSGVVISAVLPLADYQAKALGKQGARLLRRSERRRLVNVHEWRRGARAPERVTP